MWLKTLYRKRAVTWPFIFYTIIWTLSEFTKFYFVCFHHKSKLRFFKLYIINKHNFTNQRSVFYDNFSTRRSRLYRFARCRPASSKGVSSSCGR
ncbi:hypothetical protein CYQ81_03805 [Enterococcus faecium]|nr:hypothetical protein CYQ81_03805 [Enterococcus faecium]